MLPTPLQPLVRASRKLWKSNRLRHRSYASPTSSSPLPSPQYSLLRYGSTQLSAHSYLKTHVGVDFTPIQIRRFVSEAEVSYRPQTTPQLPYQQKIKHLIGGKKYEEALVVFEEMTENSVSPDRDTFILLALAMAHVNPRSSFDYLVKINSQYDQLTRPAAPIKIRKALLTKLAEKMNTKVEAPRAPRLAGKQEVPFTLEEEEPEEVLPSKSFFEQEREGLSEIFKVWVDKACPDVLLDFLLNHHVRPRLFDITLALEQCIKYRKPEEAWTLYKKWISVAPANNVFHLAVVATVEQLLPNMEKSLLTEEIIQERVRIIKKDMAEANQIFPFKTQAFLLRHYAAIGRSDYVFKLFESLKDDPTYADDLRVSDYNVVLNVCAGSHQAERAEALFESLRGHASIKADRSLYNTMIKVYARVFDAPKAWALVGEMVRHGKDPAIYAKLNNNRTPVGMRPDQDLWPDNITMSILLDMEARVNGPTALVETFEAIRNTYHLQPSLNNYGALLEQLAAHKQYIACFDWFVNMLRTSSLRVTMRECCYLTLIDPKYAPMTDDEQKAVSPFHWDFRKQAPPLTDQERRKWIGTVYRWKDMYIRNNTLNPPPELDLVALHRIKEKLSLSPQVTSPNASPLWSPDTASL